MKFRLLLMALSTILLVAACKKDEIPDGEATLKYDAGSVTGPLLAAGYHELAVYFPASTMAEYTNWNLSEVTWYMGGFPDSCIVKIYNEGAAGASGSLLYQADVTSSITVNQWNVHLLPNPLTVLGNGVWISIGLRHDSEKQSIGCDSGPNNPNGDWIFQDTDSDWKTYVERTGESINWNIRAVVEE